MWNMENIIIIGAHFDDAELGAGGTAAKFSSSGKKVYKLTLTDNVTKSEHLNLSIDYDLSLKQSHVACKLLGVHEITDFEPIECSKLEYNKEIMQRVENILFDLKIDTVFMHFMDDSNQDHVEAARICRTAARHCKNLLAYQSNLYIPVVPFHPTLFVDISDEMEKKKQALNEYTGHHNRFDRLFEATYRRNEAWGYSHKVEYAEAYHVIKAII
jgi:LmbE family N-acetylglucosaminyl deacetylase